MIKNDVNYEIAMLVVNKYRRVQDRVKKLESMGFVVTSEWVKSGGVGTIRTIRNTSGVQVSAASGGNHYVGKAFVAFYLKPF